MPKIIPLYTSGNKGFTDTPLVEVFYQFEDEKIQIKINYYFPGFTISEDKRKIFGDTEYDRWRRFHEVGISGAGFLSLDQKPLLPSFGRFVQIPAGYEVTDCTSRKYNKKKYKEQILISWAEETVSGDGKILFDEEKYRSNRFWPGNKEVVECSHPQYFYFDGYKTVLIHVRPLQYLPNKRLLHGYGKIVVSIWVSPTNGAKKANQVESALTNQPNSLKGFSNLILNPGPHIFNHLENSHHSSTNVTVNSKEPAFLIVYGQDFKQPAEKLKNWKTKRGLLTEAICVEELGKTAEHIKKYIRAKRVKPNSPLRYVLLFGDVDSIPISKDDEDGGIHTDHYYFTHKDADGSECLVPFVSGGRIPVASEEKGMLVVDQIIHFETALKDDPEYLRRVTLASYFEDRYDGSGARENMDGRSEVNNVKTMEHIRKHVTCCGHKVQRAYFSKNENPLFHRDGTPVSPDVKRAFITDKGKMTDLLCTSFKQGQVIMAQTGHSSNRRWNSPPLDVADIETIKAERLCVLFSITCSTGRFQYGSQDPCFARDLLTKSGAVVSVIAANEKSKRWRNDTLLKALFDALWPGVITRFPEGNMGYPVTSQRLGDILNYAKAYLLVKHGYNKASTEDTPCLTKEQIEMYHVIGDPTLEIR